MQYSPFHITLSNSFCDDIIKTGDLLNTTNAKIKDGNNANRSSKVSWLKEEQFPNHLHQCLDSANKLYNFSLHEFEPAQYTVYHEGDHYDWHIDNHKEPYHNGMIRKLSFTVCLNDEFEGGDFDLGRPSPLTGKTNIETFKLKKGEMIVFPSHTWHKVNKVTKGIRKTLVGWVVGSQWK